jgi:hypothetical protein
MAAEELELERRLDVFCADVERAEETVNAYLRPKKRRRP